MVPKHSLSHGYQSQALAEPVKEILFLAAIGQVGSCERSSR